VRWQYVSPDTSIVERINSFNTIREKFAARYSVSHNATILSIVDVQMVDGGTIKCLEQQSSDEHLNFQLIVFGRCL